MNRFPGVCVLLLSSQIMVARAEAPTWKWRFQPPAPSRWQLVVFERINSLTAQDMLQFSFDGKGKKQRVVRQEDRDVASHRVRFDLDVMASDASESRLRWTFRGMEATRERDGWVQSTRGDEKMPPDLRAQVQKQRRERLIKNRAEVRSAARLFNASLQGASFTLAIGSDGRILRYGGFKLWRARVAAALDGARDNNGEFASIAFRPVLVPDEMKTWVEGWTMGLPKAPLQPGQSWDFQARVADLGFLTPLSTVSRTLRSRDDERALVDETAEFIVAPPLPELKPNTVAYTFSCRGTRTSHLQIEASSGVPLRTSRRLEIQGHRGVVDDRHRSLQDEAFTLRSDLEIAVAPLPAR